MEEWAVALILIGLSLVFASLVLVACKTLGGWSYLYAWVTGNKDERANLAHGEEYVGYADYVSDASIRVPERRPPLIEPHTCFSSNMKLPEKRMDKSSTKIPNLPPPPQNLSELPSKRFSLDIVRRSSIDASELPEILAETGNPTTKLERAMSCDSVCSDTSVVLETLDSPSWVGEINVALEYSRELEELYVTVKETRGLPSLGCSSKQVEIYVKVRLQPPLGAEFQTKVLSGSLESKYNDKFVFCDVRDNEIVKQALLFSVYICSNLVGEVEVPLSHIDIKGRFEAWLPLRNDKEKTKGVGELLFSLSYLPTAERMTVVLVKARNIAWDDARPSAEIFVKVYLLQKGKKISKKKTAAKRADRNPTFNEAMIFSVPSPALQNIQLRLTLAEQEGEDKKAPAIGHVFVGPQCSGKELSHWNQMISSPRKPVAMWHTLRKRDR